MGQEARQDLAVVSVSVDGVDLGKFATKSGGQTDSEERKFKPNGQDPEISLGGSSTIENVVVGRLFDDFMQSKVIWLRSRCGAGTMVVKDLVLDADGNPIAFGETTQGKLKRVSPPDRDSNSNEAALIELEMTPGGVVA